MQQSGVLHYSRAFSHEQWTLQPTQYHVARRPSSDLLKIYCEWFRLGFEKEAASPELRVDSERW